MARQVTRAAPALALTAGLALAAGMVSAAPAPASATGSARATIQPPVPAGRLRITGNFTDGGTVAARGLSWRPGRLPPGDRVLTFEVGYAWQSCRGANCGRAADSTATPFAASRYIAGHADTGRRLRVTETATEVIQTRGSRFTFREI